MASSSASMSHFTLPGLLASLIRKCVVGDTRRPLLVLDDSRSLRQRGAVSARVAAAMSLSPLATAVPYEGAVTVAAAALVVWRWRVHALERQGGGIW